MPNCKICGREIVPLSNKQKLRISNRKVCSKYCEKVNAHRLIAKRRKNGECL